MATVVHRGDAGDLARRLGERIQSLAPELLPRGHRRSRWWRVGSLAGEEGQSLAVVLWGARQGRWHDYSAGIGGDGLDLVNGVLFHSEDIKQAMGWARHWLGLPEQQRPLPTRRRPSLGDEWAKGQREAMAIWLAAKPLTKGDLVDRYLEGRGISLERLAAANGGRVPRALRLHPGLWNGESRRHWPALVAAVVDAEGRQCAVHRIWLQERNLAFEDRPMVGKAPLDDPKMSKGEYAGGCIRLWRGQSRRSWDMAEPGETLLISEGIEDLLAFVQYEPQWRGICAVSLSNMLGLVLPPEFSVLRILAQSDAPGSPAAKLLQRVEDRFWDEGRRVFTWSRHGLAKDVNALILNPLVNRLGGLNK